MSDAKAAGTLGGEAAVCLNDKRFCDNQYPTHLKWR